MPLNKMDYKNIQNLQYRLPFDGCKELSKSYSQALQDIFVLSCLGGKRNGTFLDLGCHEPLAINNTYLLEKEFDWKGVCIDINYEVTKMFSGCRNATVLTEDCTRLDFDKIVNICIDKGILKKTENHFDYLSLDLEPPMVTLESLMNIPFDKIEFSIITYEHDGYRDAYHGNFVREKSREIFEINGYKRICSDVKFMGNFFEDWYYNPKYVLYDSIKRLESSFMEYENIVFSVDDQHK